MTLEFLFYPKLYKAQPRVDLNRCGIFNRCGSLHLKRLYSTIVLDLL